MKSRQKKALEIRDLITQVNARVAELEEDGYTISFQSKPLLGLGTRSILGKIYDVSITKSTIL